MTATDDGPAGAKDVSEASIDDSYGEVRAVAAGHRPIFELTAIVDACDVKILHSVDDPDQFVRQAIRNHWLTDYCDDYPEISSRRIRHRLADGGGI